MADFAGKIFEGAQQSIQDQQEAPGFLGGIQEGAALAAQAEAIKMRRQEFEHKRQLFEGQKDGMFLKDFKTYQDIKNPKMKKLYGEGMIKRAETRGTPIAEEFKSVITQDVLDPNATSQVISNYFSELDRSMAAGRPTEGFTEARAQFAEAVYNGNLEAVVGLEAQQIRSDKAASAQADAAQFRKDKEETRKQEKAQSAVRNIKKDFDSNIKDNRKRLEAADNALVLLSQDRPISEEVVKTQLARLAGEVGNLTEQDLARFGGSKDLVSRGRQLLTTLATGKLTPENKKQLIGIAKAFRKVVVAKIRAEGKRQIEGATVQGAAPADVQRALNIEGILKPAVNNKKPSLNLGSLNKKTFETFDQEKKQRLAERLGTTVEAIEAQLKGK